MDDHRTRPEHAALDGLVLAVDDAFWDKDWLGIDGKIVLMPSTMPEPNCTSRCRTPAGFRGSGLGLGWLCALSLSPPCRG